MNRRERKLLEQIAAAVQAPTAANLLAEVDRLKAAVARLEASNAAQRQILCEAGRDLRTAKEAADAAWDEARKAKAALKAAKGGASDPGRDLRKARGAKAAFTAAKTLANAEAIPAADDGEAERLRAEVGRLRKLLMEAPDPTDDADADLPEDVAELRRLYRAERLNAAMWRQRAEGKRA